MAEPKTKLLAVVGSTASGKSAVAVALARRLGGEVVSCDSMQIYRRMDVGTAKPTCAEQEGVPHHLIDFVDPDVSYSCAEYVQDAQRVIAEITARGALPIVCGGTGLYLDALLRGGGFEETEGDAALPEQFFSFARERGNAALHARLAQVDPESAASIHPNNVKRVVRALEIYQTTGMTKSEADRRSRLIESPYDAAVIGLSYPDRAVLYDRIDRRVDTMLERGLVAETERLMREGVFEKNATAAQAIGYKELLGALQNGEPMGEAVERLKRATRRYAKRQITWFGAKNYVNWIEMTENGEPRSLVDVTCEIVSRFSEWLER